MGNMFGFYSLSFKLCDCQFESSLWQHVTTATEIDIKSQLGLLHNGITEQYLKSIQNLTYED